MKSLTTKFSKRAQGLQDLIVISAFLTISIVFTSCSESFTRVQKSTDINYKLSKAVEYYNKKKFKYFFGISWT